jgi:hypothetical protein
LLDAVIAEIEFPSLHFEMLEVGEDEERLEMGVS